MAFIYEKIPEQDIINYGLREIDQQFSMAVASRWVIDRERNIYLRYMSYDRDAPSCKYFSFFWKGALLRLRLCSEGHSLDDTTWSTSWSSLEMRNLDAEASRVLNADSDTIMTDLKDALRTYKDGSLSPAYATHIAHFDF